MSHYSLLAIGFNDEDELEKAMAPYDESLEVAPYISKTKEQILADGIESYKERCEIIAAYKKDPVKAVEKYGKRAKSIYEDRRKRGYPNFKEPEKYYEWYVEGETIDENGNLLSTYNPNSKWDYYTVHETMTIGDLKKEREEQLTNFDASRFEMIWNIIVNGEKPSVTGIEIFSLLYGQPNKEEMLRIYGTKENYISHYKNNYYASYSVLTPQGWFEPGKVGWWGTSSATFDEEKEFRETYYAKFIEPYDDNAPVYRIDCHI